MWLLEIYILTTSKVIAGWVPTGDSVHSWQLYSAAPLGDQSASTMSRYPSQSHYPDTDVHQSLPYSNNADRLVVVVVTNIKF